MSKREFGDKANLWITAPTAAQPLDVSGVGAGRRVEARERQPWAEISIARSMKALTGPSSSCGWAGYLTWHGPLLAGSGFQHLAPVWFMICCRTAASLATTFTGSPPCTTTCVTVSVKTLSKATL